MASDLHTQQGISGSQYNGTQESRISTSAQDQKLLKELSIRFEKEQLRWHNYSQLVGYLLFTILLLVVLWLQRGAQQGFEVFQAGVCHQLSIRALSLTQQMFKRTVSFIATCRGRAFVLSNQWLCVHASHSGSVYQERWLVHKSTSCVACSSVESCGFFHVQNVQLTN